MSIPINYSCETCGTQYDATAQPPLACRICEDDRQYVGWRGQSFVTMDDLRARLKIRIERYRGVLALGTQPAFAINQRSFLIPTGSGNVL